MPSFEYDIGAKARVGSRFISRVREEIQKALVSEKGRRRLTQRAIANKLGVNRSVVNRQIMGLENLTLRSVADLLWAMDWEPYFEARKSGYEPGCNYHMDAAPVQPAAPSDEATTVSARFTPLAV